MARKTLDKMGEALGEEPGKLKQSSSSGQLREGLDRFTVISDVRTIELLKDYARWTRTPIKDAVTEAFNDYLEKHWDEFDSPIKHQEGK